MARTRQPPPDFYCPGCTQQVASGDAACRGCGFEFIGQLVVTQKPEALDRVVEARRHISWDDLDKQVTVRNAAEHLRHRQFLTSLGFQLRLVPESHRHQKALKAASATPELKLAKLLEPLGEALSANDLTEFLQAQVRILRPMPCHARTGAPSSKLT